MWKYLPFILLYMIIQHILLIVEYTPYVDMLEAIQNDLIDFTSTLSILAKTLVLYAVVYGSMLYLFIRYLYHNASYTEAFVFGSIVVAVLDFTLLGFFKKANNHIPVLLFDTFIVGGANVVIPLYLVRSNYTLFSKFTPLLILGFIITGSYSFYHSYKDTQQKLKLQEAQQKVTQ